MSGGCGRVAARRLTRLIVRADGSFDGYDPNVSHWFHVYSTWLVRVVSEGDYALALEQLSDALPVEIAAVDRTARVIVWNRAMEARGAQEVVTELARARRVYHSRLNS